MIVVTSRGALLRFFKEADSYPCKRTNRTPRNNKPKHEKDGGQEIWPSGWRWCGIECRAVLCLN